MQISEELVRQITEAVLQQVSREPVQGEAAERTGQRKPAERGSADSLKGRARINEKKSDYSGYARAQKGTNPREVVIGVGPAFQREIVKTINGLSQDEVLKTIKAGIEEEGMVPRVVKVLKTSDVCFIGLEAAKLSGSGIGIGLQSKGTAVIHQKDLYPLSNLELFPQAPQMTMEMYRKIGQNAARYVKGEQVTPIECTNDPMTRPKYQVKAALMHIAETEQVDQNVGIIEWEGKK